MLLMASKIPCYSKQQIKRQALFRFNPQGIVDGVTPEPAGETYPQARLAFASLGLWHNCIVDSTPCIWRCRLHCVSK